MEESLTVLTIFPPSCPSLRVCITFPGPLCRSLLPLWGSIGTCSAFPTPGHGGKRVDQPQDSYSLVAVCLFRSSQSLRELGRGLANSSRVLSMVQAWVGMVLVAMVLQIVGQVGAVQFEVSSRTTKCVAEDIQSNVVVVGDYKIVHAGDDSHKVTVKVTSPYGNQLHYQESVHSGQFAFTTQEAGNFMACFWMQGAPPNVNINLELDWKTGVAAKDWATIAKKDKLDGMELELKKLEEAVGSIHNEMLYLREREAEMRDLNELTNSRVAWFGIMSLLVCLSVAGWQLWHLKTFFERKKLL